MRTDSQLHYDVIIVGAGVVGGCLAALLHQNGFSCAVVEATPEKKSPEKENQENKNQTEQNTAYDPRALAVTLASKNIIDAVGVWKSLPQDRLGQFRTMHVWDENGLGEVNFDSRDVGELCMGYIVEQSVIETALKEELKSCENVHWFRPAEAKLLEAMNDKIYVGLDDGRQLSASLLVAADGQSSMIRRLAGINFKTHDYQQHALACVVETEFPHNGVARQRFLSDGPLAFLPMAKPNQCGIVWSTTPEHAQALKNMDDQHFNQTLAEAFTYHAGEIIKNESRATFPLARAQTEEYCRPRLAIVGDAAHRIHPLAGQGANIGLLDVACLAEVLAKAKQKNRDIGAYSVLRKYERWRKGDNSSMMMTMEGFKYLFENKMSAVASLRNAGMDLFDSIAPVKNTVMKHAMGLTGDLPEVARRTY